MKDAYELESWIPASWARPTVSSPLTFHAQGHKPVPVESVEAAAEQWNRYRAAMGELGVGGVSQIGNGGTVKCGKQIVARISYNGRIWRD